MSEKEKVTQEQINEVVGAILRTYGDTKRFEDSLQSVQKNAKRIDTENQIAELRRQQREFNEQIEAQIQELLGM